MAAGRLIFVALLALLVPGGLGAELREPVHPRRNVDDFQPVTARFVRFTIHATNLGEPGIDELEIYGPEDDSRNLALAAHGARATASGSLAGYRIHELKGINDGRYGNGHCWIGNEVQAWVQIELPHPARVHRVVWSRDREGKFIDRLATEYVIETALEPGQWHLAASSATRRPPTTNALTRLLSPVTQQFVNRFAPVSTGLSSESDKPAEYTMDVWQTPDGLPANTVTAIAQSADGYLWVGTLNGLARFDGMRFTRFSKPEGLPNSRVLCLQFDRSDALWIGTEGGGVVRMQDGRFDVLTVPDGLAHDLVLSLAEDSAGRIWIGTADGLSCWAEGGFVQDRVVLPGVRGAVSRIVADGERMWLAQEGSVWLLRDGQIERPDLNEPSWFSSLYALHRGPSNRLWFGGANRYVSCLDSDEVTVFPEQAGLLLGTIWELLETRSGDVWAGTAASGLLRLRDGQFTSLTTQEGLSDNSVRCLFEDREGNLWVGTVGGGLNRIKPRRLTTFTTREGLSHQVVMSLAEDQDGTIWIGSNCGGLNSRGPDGRIQPFSANYLLDNECVWSLLSARDGTLWIGTWGGGLFRKQGNEVTSIPLGQVHGDQAVLALFEDRARGIWIGTYASGLKWLRNGALTTFTTAEGLSANFITAIVQEENGVLWVGTGGAGLNRLEWADGSKETLRVRTTVYDRQHGLPNDFIRTLHLDEAGVLWIGTDTGLARMKEGKIAGFTRAQGLPDDVISQILEDASGHLWLGSNQGILRLGKQDLDNVAARRSGLLNVVAFGRADGMESAQCTGGFNPAGLRGRDGTLWFSTVKGLVMLEPGRIPRNEIPPPVLIEEVRVEGGVVKEGEALLRLPPRMARLEFHYTATSLMAAEKNRFRYKLEGLETEWVEAGTQRIAAYHWLPPGRYRFRVAACNADGVWNEQGASVALRVLPPFWQTWWFGAMTGLIVLGGGGWSVRYWSVRRLRRKLRLLQEQHALEKERARIAQDIHDELGASLTRIALLTELGQKHRDRPGEVAADLGKISATAREAARAMDAIVWAVNPRNDSLDHFANYVSQFAEEFFRLTPIRCRLDVPADLPERPLSTEARHHLFLAVKEALNNVVRHSGAREAWLRLACEPRELRIVVEDDGRGLPQAPPTAGHNGLVNIRNRMEDLGGRFRIESREGGGTRLIMSLPLSGETALPGIPKNKSPQHNAQVMGP
jgi:ligand-binding sensor domain-containing protein/two-component sensor histidine kinase